MSNEYHVRDFMTVPATSISRDACLLDAKLLLHSTGCRHLPVVDGDRLVGIITESDVNRFAPSLLNNVTEDEYNVVFERTPLHRVMIRDLHTVTPDTTLQDAAALLEETKVGCLPVVEEGRLVGIITVIDMLRALVRLLGGVPQMNFPVKSR